MKARVIATGEIVEVIAVGDYINEFGQIIGEYKDANGILYTSYDLDFYIEEGITIPDYWTRLEHTYAGMAMQGILGNQTYTKNLLETSTSAKDARDIIVDASYYFAHALVEKYKKEE